jgi:hypothetical protein
MTDVPFSRQDIEDLAGKLDSLQSQLSDSEQTLLLAIFSAARDRVRAGVAEAAPEVTADDLRQQLLNAFIPGGGTSFIISDIKIGPGPGAQVLPG